MYKNNFTLKLYKFKKCIPIKAQCYTLMYRPQGNKYLLGSTFLIYYMCHFNNNLFQFHVKKILSLKYVKTSYSSNFERESILSISIFCWTFRYAYFIVFRCLFYFCLIHPNNPFYLILKYKQNYYLYLLIESLGSRYTYFATIVDLKSL